jgi:5,10-methylenetetrahydromethanopterin reductase
MSDEPAPVVEDMSAWIISGAVKAKREGEYESDGRTPPMGLDDAVEAERLGFRRVFLSERWDIKEAGVILSGAAARTSRIEIGTGVIAPSTRHPWQTAAFAATMQVCYGERFLLGLGRGESAIFPSMGLRTSGIADLRDYVAIFRALWRGETVSYDGPVGSFPALAFSDRYEGEPPPVFYGTFARPKGAALAAEAFDGVMLPTMMTPDATRRMVRRLDEACERIGRDPASLRKVMGVVTAPDLGEIETRSLAHGRAVGYLQYPGYGKALAEENQWDPAVIEGILGHPRLTAQDKIADRVFHRHELLEPAELVPDEWMSEACATGTASECVAALERFRDAGVDEIATYGSTPGQNAELISLWRERAVATVS